MRSREIEQYKLSLKLSKTQKSILVGTLLGDSHLETRNDGKTYKLRVEHSSKQAFYVDWMYEHFKDWVLTPPKYKEKQVFGKIYQNYYFSTLSVGNFRFYGKQFYDINHHKVVPKQIGKWLTPLALAVWIMDDGSSKSKYHRAVILNTQGFSRSDINILIKALQSVYGIEANFRKQREGLQLIVVGKSAELLYKTVQKYMLPNFTYKFGALDNTLPKE
jgi:ubiquinol-cytochrome c reductase cytochrome b subunit